MNKGVAVITGSGRGIGAAAAKLAAQRGFSVCINYLGRADRAQAVVDEIRANDGKAILVQADTAVEADVVRLFDMVDRELGPVAALVNNAGIIGKAGRHDVSDTETIRRVLDVNVLGTMLCTREAVKRMSTKTGGAGGSIVNVSSIAAVLGGGEPVDPLCSRQGSCELPHSRIRQRART